MKILLVEDDRELVDMLVFAFRRAGMATTVAHDVPSGLARFEEEHPDLIVLDLHLGATSGFDLLRQVRERSEVPIIVLSALNGEDDKIRGLSLGADDYVTKPFSHRELLTRVQMRLRRPGQAPVRQRQDVLRVADIDLDATTHTVRRNGAPVNLTVTEFRLLHHLMVNAGEVVPTSELLRHVWGYSDPTDTDVLRVTLHRLRRKLGEHGSGAGLVRTVPGVGVLLKGEREVAPGVPASEMEETPEQPVAAPARPSRATLGPLGEARLPAAANEIRPALAHLDARVLPARPGRIERNGGDRLRLRFRVDPEVESALFVTPGATLQEFDAETEEVIWTMPARSERVWDVFEIARRHDFEFAEDLALAAAAPPATAGPAATAAAPAVIAAPAVVTAPMAAQPETATPAKTAPRGAVPAAAAVPAPLATAGPAAAATAAAVTRPAIQAPSLSSLMMAGSGALRLVSAKLQTLGARARTAAAARRRAPRAAAERAPAARPIERPAPATPAPRPRAAAATAEGAKARVERTSEQLSTAGRWVVALLGVSALAALASIWSETVHLSLLQRLATDQPVTVAAFRQSEARRFIVAIALLGLYLSSAVAFLVWIRSAYMRLRARGVVGLRYSPVRAVVSFFIPLVFFFLPHRVMTELWHASPLGRGARVERTRKAPGLRAPLLITAWWTAFLAFMAAALWTGKTTPDPDLEQLFQQVWTNLTADGLAILAAGLAIVLIARIEMRQHEADATG